MKRTCNGCVALEDTSTGIGKECRLGYKINSKETIHGVPLGYEPLEECEKPKSYIQLFSIKK